MRRMRFAISIPQFYGDGEFDPVAFRGYCGRVEQLGFESAWVQENIPTSSPQLGPIEVMTYAAACTQRLRLGCVVFVTTLHSPAHLAKSLSTLDQLSGGRLEIGVGTGGKARPFGSFGITEDRYIARFTEGIALMKALWTQPRVTFDGEFWQLSDAAMEPKTVQKPYAPPWFGASAKPSLRRAVRLGAPLFGAGWDTPAAFAGQCEIVRQALAEAGRDPGSFPIAKRMYVVVDDDAERGRERGNDAMARVYGRRIPAIEAAAFGGTPADCIREANAVAAAGAEMILFTAVADQR